MTSWWNFWKKEIKLVCFDMDNTLYDYSIAEAETEVHISGLMLKLLKTKKISQQDILKAFVDVKKSHMHHESKPEGFSRALWIREVFDGLISQYGLKTKITQNVVERLEKEYWKFLNPRLKLFPNTLNTLKALKDMGFMIATITDSDGKREFKLERLKAAGLDGFFDIVITTDDTGINKPAIENFQYLLDKSGLNGKNCVMIGDHPEVDLINAKKLRFTTIWTKEHINIDAHYKFVDYEITDIGQVVGIVNRIRA